MPEVKPTGDLLISNHEYQKLQVQIRQQGQKIESINKRFQSFGKTHFNLVE